MANPSVFSWAAALALVALGCAPASSEAPLRSPSRDYPPPPTSSADGEVIGADEVPPGERLERGPSVGSENALAPGWEADEKGLRHDPKQRVGGAIDETKVKEP